MTMDNVNTGRRRFLVGATSALGAVGAVGVATPFVSSWAPSARAKSAGAPVKFNVGKLEPGSMVTVEWRRQPIYVVRRTQEALDQLAAIAPTDLKDPNSDVIDQQPDWAKNGHRSSNPEYLVIKGVCTHLGCAPKFRPELAPEDLGPDWVGGFFCPCHGSRFDMAGRVMSGSPAGTNLPVPPYRFDGDVVVIGEDQEQA